MLFPGMSVKEYSFFRVTRDADLELRDIEADDLMSALEEGLRKRRKGGEVVRLEVSKNTPKVNVHFKNMFPTNLSSLEYSQELTDVEYFKATASFRYLYYEFETVT